MAFLAAPNRYRHALQARRRPNEAKTGIRWLDQRPHEWHRLAKSVQFSVDIDNRNP